MSRGRPPYRALLLAHLLAASFAVAAPVFFATGVAPEAFRVLPSRALAGDLTGAVLARLCAALEACYAVLLVTTWLLTRPSRKSRGTLILRRVPILAFFSALTTRSLIVPAAERIRRSLPAGTDLAGADPLLRQRFDRLHTLSVALLLLEIVCGFALLALAARLTPAEEEAVPPRPPSLPAR